MRAYRFKLAQGESEREQVHRLNYETFVEEIPQHLPNAERRLVDRFDAENEYVIALAPEGALAGMLALRGRRPFSLDQKLERLDEYLPPHRSVCELRLLAVRREHRRGTLFRRLVAFAARRCIESGYDLAVISGTTRQLALYRHLGFEPFGPLVGAPDARFQPMFLSLERLRACAGAALGIPPASPAAPARFTPGPVAVSAAVRAALCAPAAAHRSGDFVAGVGQVRRALCDLTGAGDAVLMVGTGTLANDAVASALRSLRGRGVIVVNGEFGERLVEHGRCAGLTFDAVSFPWGAVLEEPPLAEALARGDVRWIWAVHCETSTGMLNDIALLKRLARESGAPLCLDCVSSIGAVPLGLEDVWLASASSGKGLGAFAGLAVVLMNGAPPACEPFTPRYLDLAYWLRCDSVPFTHSSNLVAALEAALQGTDWRARQRLTAADAHWLRAELRARGLAVIAPDAAASPSVLSLALPAQARADAVAPTLAGQGFELGWRSAYLVARNWIQVALMGEYDRVALRRLPEALAAELRASFWRDNQAA